MRWLLLLLFPASLAAMDAEAVRFARRTLLDETARAHLNASVRDLGALTAGRVLGGDFDGDGNPDHAAILRREAAHTIALFPDGGGESPTGLLHLSLQDAPEAEVLALPGRAGIRLRVTTGDDDHRRETWTILRWNGKAWVQAAVLTGAETRLAANARWRRESSVALQVAGDDLEVVTTTRELLDNNVLDGSAVTHRVTLRLGDDGAFAPAGEQAPLPVASRVQLARKLEREGLFDIALEHAREAVAQAEREKLPANDPRHLDARTLKQRLETRTTARVAK